MSLRYRLFLLSGASALALAGCGISEKKGSGAAADPPRPNIVLILADDLGFSDIGCYGSAINTPNLDKLAAEGLLFTRFYNSGRCCPSRASLLTGMYSHKAGVGHMTEELDHPSYRGFLNDHCMTIAEALKSGGYSSYMTGKWHVGTDRSHWPLQRGFAKFYGSNTSQGHYFKVYEGRKLLRGNEETGTAPGWYATDAFTDSAITFMKQHFREKKDAPFFLYVAYTAPHWPIHALPEDIQKYRGMYLGGYDSTRRARYERMEASGIIDEAWKLSGPDERVPAWNAAGSDGEPPDKKEEDLKMAVYAAMIDRMDQGIGRILAALRDLGISENTMVVFLSDNGGSAEEIHRGEPGAVTGSPESYTSIGLPWANVSNTPFRKFKSWVYEGGISTPLIIRYPPLTEKGGRRTSQVGHIIDLMPTFLELAGVSYPDTCEGRALYPLDGSSLLPVLRSGKRKGHDALFWEHQGNKAVRKDGWKLVSAYKGDWELYNLENDRTETTDLKEKYPEKAAELARLYESWAKKNHVLPWDSVKALRDLNDN